MNLSRTGTSPATLAQCTACRRHVRVADPECPFCGATSTEAPRPALRSAGATRAVVFTVGAALLGAVGCGDTHSGSDTGPEEVDAGAVAMPYGAPPADHLV